MEWISVKEHLPADERHVLVYCEYKDEFGMCIANFVDDQWWGKIEWGQINVGYGEVEVFTIPSQAITHWMELPNPPKPWASTCRIISPQTSKKK